MVKLEPMMGSTIYVSPSSVAWIAAVVDDDKKIVGTMVKFNSGDYARCKGTPDEVHAKLFPQADASVWNDSAAKEVLEYVADAIPDNNTKIWARPYIVTLARKALGREEK